MDTPVQDNKSVESGLKTSIPALVEVPQRLAQLGIISAQDWALLPDDHKKQILASHGINPDQYIEQYNSAASVNQVSQVESQSVSVVEMPQPQLQPVEQKLEQAVVTPNPHAEIKKEFESIKKEVENSEKLIVINKETLVQNAGPSTPQANSAEDMQRIAIEKGMAQNAGTPKLFGYQPTQVNAANASQIADSNPVIDGRTWVASILKKILLSFK